MKESMANKIFDLIKNNLKNPKFYAGLFLILVIMLLLFPYIDANYFYYGRVEKRINILEKVIQLNDEKLEENEILKNEYESILNEISKQKNGSIGSIFITENSKEVDRNKFISGGLLLWIFAALCLFLKMDKVWYKFFGLICFGAFGAVLGYISMIVPTIISPMCNYIMMPVFQIIIVGFMMTAGKNRK